MNPVLSLFKPQLLHIPDGLLSLPIALLFWAVSAILITVAIHHTRDELGERQIPLMGVMAAFIFAAQMIDFPVVGGTSGHLLGGVLAAITLGPWAGMLVMTSVIGVQALLFQDGGLLVMGANVFNMGLLTALIGFGLYRSVAGHSRTLRWVVTGMAAWLSVIAAALATSLQLWLSGNALLEIIVPAMLGTHALIGIGEAAITMAAVTFILRTRPDLIEPEISPSRHDRRWVIVGAVVSLAVLLLSPWAVTDPDGLERVATDLGFLGRSTSPLFHIFPDYTFPGLGSTSLSTILAGGVGALIVAGLILLAARLLRRSARP